MLLNICIILTTLEFGVGRQTFSAIIATAAKVLVCNKIVSPELVVEESDLLGDDTCCACGHALLT